MPYLKWNPALNIGLLELDEQHKILFNIANDLIAAIERDEGEAVLKETFNRLKIYTETHFSAEEAYMKKLKYPGLEVHQKEHADLLDRTNTLWKMLKEGQTVTPESVSRFIMGWIVDHIMDTDKAVGDFAQR